MTTPENTQEELPRRIAFIATPGMSMALTLMSLARAHNLDAFIGDRQPVIITIDNDTGLIESRTIPSKQDLDVLFAIVAAGSTMPEDLLTLSLKRMELDVPALYVIPDDSDMRTARREEWRRNMARHDYRQPKYTGR